MFDRNPHGETTKVLINIENLVGQVRDIWLCLEMTPDGVLEYWSVGVLVKIARFLSLQIRLS